jgi:hypothetical protein
LGVIDFAPALTAGWPEKEETLQLAPGMPPLHTSLLAWNNAGPPEGQHIIYQLVCRNNKFHDLAEIVVCNSFQEAEAGAFKLYPNVLPIGALRRWGLQETRRQLSCGGHELPQMARRAACRLRRVRGLRQHGHL